MKRSLTFIVILCIAQVSLSQSESHIDFVVKNVGINVNGHFNTFNITSQFNASGELTSVSGTIEVASIETGIDSRDEHLLKKDYFDQANHPLITLKSNRITFNKQGGHYDAVADLTIKGVTRQIKVPLFIDRENDFWKLASNFEINRKDYDVGGFSFVLAKTVRIAVIHYEPIK